MSQLSHILETCLYGDDLAAMEAFYTPLLGREPYSVDPGHFVFYKLDHCMLLIFNADKCENNGDIPAHGSRGRGHAAFRVDESEIDAWKSRLEELGIPLEQEHTWSNGSRSLYFRDPADNSMEIASWSIWGRYD